MTDGLRCRFNTVGRKNRRQQGRTVWDTLQNLGPQIAHQRPNMCQGLKVQLRTAEMQRQKSCFKSCLYHKTVQYTQLIQHTTVYDAVGVSYTTSNTNYRAKKTLALTQHHRFIRQTIMYDGPGHTHKYTLQHNTIEEHTRTNILTVGQPLIAVFT